MIRVLHVHTGNMFGGVETLLMTIARGSGQPARVEHQFAVCFEGRFRKELESIGARVHTLGAVRLSRPWTVLRARSRLGDLIRRTEPDVVVLHSPWAQVVFGSTARKAAPPQVLWGHDLIDGTTLLQKLARLSPPEHILSNSSFTQKHIQPVFPHVDSQVIFCPVTIPAGADAGPEELAQIRADLETDRDSVVIIQVSRLEPYKGHLLHLRGLAEIADQPDWTAWFIGGAQRPAEHAYLDQLRDEARRLGIADRVRFTGQRRDIGGLLQAADIFCQPNAGPEPFGIVFIEAMAMGLPVVSTAMGGAVEIVDSSSGILVEPDRPEALGEALRRLIEDPEQREQMGAAGPARARSIADPAEQLEKIEDALAEIAARRR